MAYNWPAYFIPGVGLGAGGRLIGGPGHPECGLCCKCAGREVSVVWCVSPFVYRADISPQSLIWVDFCLARDVQPKCKECGAGDMASCQWALTASQQGEAVVGQMIANGGRLFHRAGTACDGCCKCFGCVAVMSRLVHAFSLMIVSQSLTHKADANHSSA